MYIILNFDSMSSIKLTRHADNEKQKNILANDPKMYLAYRKKIESELNSRFWFILNGSQEQTEARAVSCNTLLRY